MLYYEVRYLPSAVSVVNRISLCSVSQGFVIQDTLSIMQQTFYHQLEVT